MTAASAPSDSLQIALSLAARLGVACERPLVLSEGMSTVVHLRPSAIVARVTSVTHLVRPVEALAAYRPHDEAAVAALDPLVVLATAAWGATSVLLGRPIGPRTQRRLDWLRERHLR